MDRLAAMRVFVAVVDAQGFSAASRALSMPLPTVSRKIAELESQECADVRFWLQADMQSPEFEVCFTPESGRS